MIAAREAAGDRVLLVEAPVGYGKSAFAEAVLSLRRGPIVRLRPAPVESGSMLARALHRSMRRANLALDGAESLEETLDRTLAVLAAASEPVHLFVDDAHALDHDDLSGLVELATDLPDQCALIVCAQGDPLPLDLCGQSRAGRRDQRDRERAHPRIGAVAPARRP